MKKLVLVIASVALLSSCAGAAELPTAAELQDKVAKAYATMTSFEADKQFTLQGPTSGSAAEHMAMEKSAKGGKTVEKAIRIGKATIKDPGGKETTEEGKMVNDGSFSWDEHRVADGVQVRKCAAEDAQAFRLSEGLGKEMARFWTTYILKVVGEDTIDGRKMYVLEGAWDPAKLDKAVTESKAKVWVDEGDFIVRRVIRTVRFAGKEQPMVSTAEYLNVKLNQPVDPKQFEYAPPAGAKVDDQTKPKP